LEENISPFLTLLCIVVPCLVVLGAIVGGIVFFVKRGKKAAPPSPAPAATAAPPSQSVAPTQPAGSGPEQPGLAGLSLTPSEVVALKGDLFAPSAGILNSWKLAGSEAKVSGPPLAQNMLAAAFLALEQAGNVSLEQGKKKATLGLREVDTVLVTPTEQPSNWPPGSFEARIITSARARQASSRNNVKDITFDALEEDAGLVWNWALRLAHNGLAQRGLLNAEVKKGLLSSGLAQYSLSPATSAALAETDPAEVRQLLGSCEKDRPKLFQLLNKEIKKGFDSRKEAPEGDDGGGFEMAD
jgi:hypothetical protein